VSYVENVLLAKLHCKKGSVWRSVLWTSLRDSFVEEKRASLRIELYETILRAGDERERGKKYMKM
jgi:hypothetical protein